MGEIACDACGAKRHGESCGIAFVYRSLSGWWHAEFSPLKKQLDATALELQAVALGMHFLAKQSMTHQPEPEVRVYSDASRLFEYLDGAKVVERHEAIMADIIASRVIMEFNGVAVQFEQVLRHQRERYPLYLMADALTRHARTLPLE